MSAVPSFLPVPLDTLVSEAKVEFDLYLQLNTKHVLYLRKGGVFDSARLTKIREKNVKNMWILAEEEARYRLYFDRKLDMAYDLNSPMTATERAAFILGALAASAEAVMRNPSDVGAYMEAVAGAKRFTEFLTKSDPALKLMLGTRVMNKSVASHGTSVSVIAVGLAKKLGMGEYKDLYLLTLGCMLHDLGHFKQPEASGFGRNLKELTNDQLRAFREHAIEGARTLQDLAHVDRHVLKIILEHEEYVDGTGYPKGLNERQMHPYSMIASTANSFDQIASRPGETLQTAMKKMLVEKIGRHTLGHLNALKAVIQTL